MAYKRVEVPAAELERQREICAKIREGLGGARPLAFVDTYGCQQNEADSEALRGYIELMGFGFTEDENEAELIVVNTCAVRGHAEMRVLGNVGALVHAKARNPRLIVAVCGCMVQQPHMAEKIKNSFRVVDLCFGPHELWRFPELYERAARRRGRVFEVSPCEGVVAEGLPVHRQGSVKAWLSVMYGCNNFCTYCIVPYVRGRERSRRFDDVVDEARSLVEAGYKDITLLGQNVNSYGKDLGEGRDFADLIRAINDIPGDFLIRFMTSHPKDASQKLFDTMASSPKIAPCFHLPFQAGSDRILKAMNRVYDRAGYLDKVRRLRAAIPDVVITSDVIVGFPGETAEDFEQTMTLIDQVRFDALFTFIFSPREGTPAAKMDDPISKEEKAAHFQRLVERQDQISEEKHRAYIGRTVRCLVDGKDDKGLTARTPGNRLVRLTGDDRLIGQFVDVKITGANKWSLSGEPA